MKIKQIYSGYVVEATKLCTVFLKPILTKIAPHNWWKTLVIDKLSEMQKSNVGKSIGTLDLAMLLTAFNKNWDEIVLELKKENKKLARTDRDIVVKMMDFRIHDAHYPVGGLPPKDIQSDLDTLWRFLKIVGADEKLIQGVKYINKHGFACGYNENELDRIINSKKQGSEKKNSTTTKKSILKKPEKPKRTRVDTKTEQQRQSAIAEQQRQSAIAEQQRQEAIAEQQRQSAIAEQQRQWAIAEQQRQWAIAEQQRQEAIAKEQRQKIVRERNERNNDIKKKFLFWGIIFLVVLIFTGFPVPLIILIVIFVIWWLYSKLM